MGDHRGARARVPRLPGAERLLPESARAAVSL